MKTLLKKVNRFWKRYIHPVSCRRCDGWLFSETERARGISNRCRKLEIEEKARQVKETEQYFYTKSGIVEPSPMFLNIGDILKHPGYDSGLCHIWKGSPDAAILVELSGVGE